MPDDLEEKNIELHLPKGIHLKDAKIIDEASGSLIIWTQTSNCAFETKDRFFAAIEKILIEVFSKSLVDINRAVDVKIEIAIEDDGKCIFVFIFATVNTSFLLVNNQ